LDHKALLDHTPTISREAYRWYSSPTVEMPTPSCQKCQHGQKGRRGCGLGIMLTTGEKVALPVGGKAAPSVGS